MEPRSKNVKSQSSILPGTYVSIPWSIGSWRWLAAEAIQPVPFLSCVAPTLSLSVKIRQNVTRAQSCYKSIWMRWNGIPFTIEILDLKSNSNEKKRYHESGVIYSRHG